MFDLVMNLFVLAADLNHRTVLTKGKLLRRVMSGRLAS
jgi:hypothetical protein